jgi:hypothetical protein
VSAYTRLFKWSDIKTEKRFIPVPCAACKKVLGQMMAEANWPLAQIPICFCSEECINEIFVQSRQVPFYSVRKAGKDGRDAAATAAKTTRDR